MNKNVRPGAAALLGLLCTLIPLGCGSSHVQRVSDLRIRLDEHPGLEEAAPELVGAARVALEDSDRAAVANDDDGVADHLTRARLLIDAADVEERRLNTLSEVESVEQEIEELREASASDERARRALSRQQGRQAAIEAARREVSRALEQATDDEARPGRRRRVSMDEASDLRRAAAALRARAMVLAAAAATLGAPEDAQAAVIAAVEESRAAGQPQDALNLADVAHNLSMQALGQARRAATGPGVGAATELAEAATALGLPAVALPEGMSVNQENLFSGGRLRRGVGPRVARLIALIQSHPHGPVQIQIQAPGNGRAGERLREERGTSLQGALVAGGIDAERLSLSALPQTLSAGSTLDRVRVIFVAYDAVP